MLQRSPMYSYIPAKDVDRARKFYEDKLGFRAWFKDSEGNILAVIQSEIGK